MTDLTGASVEQLTTWYSTGEVSPVEVAEASIAIARTRGTELNAIAVMNAEAALDEAAASGKRWATGEQRSPIDGVPVSIKDSFPMTGLKRWHGSRLNDPAPPSRHDGAPVKRLREAGAVLFAKSSMPDFGLVGAGVSSQFGIIRNPWDPRLNPGGSSSGSGALLAMGAGTLSVGTDMGGSVRMPAALCGVVGLKPTQGRIAYDPPKLIGSAGPMARSVADTAALLRVIGRPDPSDHLSLPGRFEWDGVVPSSLAGVEVGVLTQTGGPMPVATEILAAIEAQARVLEAFGARVEWIDRPLVEKADIRTFGSVLIVRGLPELLAVPEDQWHLLPPDLLQRMSDHRSMSAVEHVANEKAVEAFRQRIAAVHDAYDYVLSPVFPTLSFPAEKTAPPDGTDIDSIGFTAVYNLSGLPAGTVPAAMSASGLPIGVQIGGRRFDDAGVLAVLGLLERERESVIEYPFADTVAA